MIQAFRIALAGLLFLAGVAWGAPAGYKIEAAGKSPLFIRNLGEPGAEALSLREPLLYLGASLTWRPASKTADIEVGGRKATLMLEEPWLYLERGRLRLPSPPHWQGGRLVAARATWEAMAKELLSVAPGLQEASLAELASFAAPTPGSLPTLQPPDEPQLLPREPVTAARLPKGALRRVVIDPGHGGHDPGALGKGGMEEKDLCLDIALRLRRLVSEQLPGMDVVLTRDNDRFISLRQRTVIANESDADLFISIHNNASLNRASRGSQVFFYDSRSSDKAAEDLARRENEDANYLEILMTDLAKSLVRDQSILLAQMVQDALGGALHIHERGLSYAPFYVLARTKMPAILVEVAFLSNPKEERMLGSAQFREKAAMSILQGLKKYRVELASQ